MLNYYYNLKISSSIFYIFTPYLKFAFLHLEEIESYLLYLTPKLSKNNLKIKSMKYFRCKNDVLITLIMLDE